MTRAIFVCLSLLPAMATAQTIDVQTGDHAAFTRLVLTIPPQTEWQIVRTANGYRATLATNGDGFDLSGAFDVITRDRISNLEGRDLTLDIDVACACHIDAFLHRPEYLVIDIVDGPAPEDSEFETEVAETAPGEPDETPAQPQDTPMRSPLPVLVPSATDTSLIAALPFAESLPGPRDANILAAEVAIAESFARAATQGIFDFPALPVTLLPDEGEEPQAPAPIVQMTDPMDGVPVPLEEADPNGPGFVLRTSLDRDTSPEDDAASNCPINMDLEMTTWGEPGGFSILIPELRAPVIDDAGNVSPRAMRRLARAYIYYGFGVEARQALNQIPLPNDSDRLLIMLSRIVDNEPVAVADLLPYRSCGLSMEAWIALASGRVDSNDERLTSAIIVAHQGFPDAIRGHLGIRLAQSLAAAGLLHSASNMLALSTNTVTGDSLQTELAEADLIGAFEGPEAEIDQLNRIVEQDPRAAPETMVRLMDLSRETEVPVADDILEIAETMRFQANGTEPTADLAEAEVRLLIQSNRPFDALALLEGDIGPMSEDTLDNLRSLAVVNIATTAAQGPFLDFAFSPLPPSLSEQAMNAIARRLIDLGFPAEAEPFLAGSAEGEAALERIELRAQAALDQSGLARAEDTTTEQAPAADVIEQVVSNDIDVAWRGGAWEELAASDDPLLSAASQALLTPAIVPGEDAALAEGAQLLEQAQATRALTSELLERFSVDEN